MCFERPWVSCLLNLGFTLLRSSGLRALRFKISDFDVGVQGCLPFQLHVSHAAPGPSCLSKFSGFAHLASTWGIPLALSIKIAQKP